MARINPKLNLNKTPQNVEDSSLVFAKNIKLTKDLSIFADTSIDSIKHWEGEANLYPNVVGKIVGVNSKIYFFTNENNGTIYEYNELTNESEKIKCSWTYHNGVITGCVTVNNTGEEILTIAESDGTEDVPIKHINLAQCSENDEESIYTQAPNIPITNLNLTGYYTCQIPNGVYQFFIRYKIRDEFYTEWFPASKELFAGNHNETSTVQGKLIYTKTDRDSDESFVLSVEHLYSDYLNLYKEYQIGFIVSNDNGTFARAWKHFSIGNTTVYFSYNKNDIEEINIDDLLRFNFEIFNSKNTIAYKNKLYLSNYKETNFNPNDNYEEYNAKKINISVRRYFIDPQISLFLNNRPLFKENNYYKYIGIEDDSSLIKDVVYFNSNYCNNSINIITPENDVIRRPYFDRRIVSEYSQEFNPVEFQEFINRNNCNFNKAVVLGIYIATQENNQGVYYDFYEDGTIIPQSPTILQDVGNYGVYDTISVDFFINKIKKFIVGLSDETTPKFIFECYDENKNKVNITADDVYFLFSECTFDVRPTEGSSSWIYTISKKIWLHKFTSVVNTNLLSNEIVGRDYPHKENTNTLIPFSQYDFYLHFVKQNGIVTNGYYINSIIPTPSSGESLFDGIRYPAFNNIINSNNYAACFISMIKSDTIVAQCFNLEKKGEITEDGMTTYQYEVDCLELDTMLYNLNDNITLCNSRSEGYNIITEEAKYYASGDSSDIKAFGSRGYIKFSYTVPSESSGLDGEEIYVLVENNNNINKNELIKVTPYIKLNEDVTNYNNPFDLNLRGYICFVNKLHDIFDKKTEGQQEVDDYDRQIFISGNDAFVKTIDGQHIELNNWEKILSIQNEETPIEIKSSFNLNYLSLTELLTHKVRSYKDNNVDKSELVFMVNSMISSSIYKLESMYKDYVTKTYSKYDNKKVNTFNNTVRSSNIDVDEVYRSIYKFDAVDYYNVPTNRGIIINMFTIVNKIYVHCEHALFVFTDTNMMKVGENLYTSSNTEVALQQSSPFEIGIQEVLDSAYGYAGIQNKKHSLVTFNSYIFYDKLANTIYAYGGDSQITPISDSIDKLLKWFQPEDILFAADDTNNRFFINLRKIVNNNYENVCLSFNFTAKSFVSIHDMDFDESFNSRINTYFTKQITENNTNKTKVFKISKTERDSNNFTTDYNEIKKTSALTLLEVDNLSVEGRVANSIDIICNIQYEKTKVLNWINWICQEITNYDSNNGITLAEESVKKYSGHFLRIYSDETYSPLLPLINDENEPLMSNNVPLSVENGLYNPAIRTYPRYNCGVWSMNDFRDIKNITKGNKADSDDKSLLYGKYFVIRFIFKDKNFKFENIKYNMGDYEKN